MTRAVQNYVEEMRAKAKISLKETNNNNSKVLMSFKNYSNFHSSNCVANLNLNLINDEVISCTITNDGLITVQWGDKVTNPDQSYTYKLQAGQE